MSRRILINASHPEETRVVVISGNRLEEFDYENTARAQLKGNIYLAKIISIALSFKFASSGLTIPIRDLVGVSMKFFTNVVRIAIREVLSTPVELISQKSPV